MEKKERAELKAYCMLDRMLWYTDGREKKKNLHLSVSGDVVQQGSTKKRPVYSVDIRTDWKIKNTFGVSYTPRRIREAFDWIVEAMLKGHVVYYGTAKARCWYGFTAATELTGMDLKDALISRNKIQQILEKEHG
jgi:hypothetical protein